jgi:hypothetical protein
MKYFSLVVAVTFFSLIASAIGEERPRRHLTHSPSPSTISHTHRIRACTSRLSPYTYFECAMLDHAAQRRLSQRRSLIAASKAKALPATSSLQVMQPETLGKPSLSFPKPASLIPVALDPMYTGRRSSCTAGMDRCYEGCKVDGGRPEFCNSTCTTDRICAAPLKLNYGQFLDFQVEMMAIPGHSQPRIALLAALAPQLSH